MSQLNQRGAALIIIVMALFVGVAALFFGGYVSNRHQLAHEAVTLKALAQARELVLGYAVTSAAGRPGGLIFPDRSSDGNYDAQEDCSAGPLNGGLLIGKMPYLAEPGCIPPLPSFGVALSDAGGEGLWYAVSRHLMRPQAVLNTTTTGNWLTVRRADGTVMANEAAVVIIAPGPVVAGQSRAGVPGPAQFLDSVTITGTVYSNSDNDEDFIQALPSDTFNDRLAWITRAELMTALTMRVAADVKRELEKLPLTPFPADLSGLNPTEMSYWGVNWQPVASYVKVDNNKATLIFSGCAITYTLERGKILGRSQSGC